MSLITAIQTGTNSELIATASILYPLSGDVIDLTPGPKNGFWKDIQPERLWRLDPTVDDFRSTLHTSQSFDHVLFDPPYVAPGGRKTSSIDEMNSRYGMQHTAKTPWDQWDVILDGLTEAGRLLRMKGLLWFKCMDYVSSGKVHWFTKLALGELEQRGFTLVDEFILNGKPGPQPKENLDGTPRRQVHARRAHSSLMIAKKVRLIQDSQEVPSKSFFDGKSSLSLDDFPLKAVTMIPAPREDPSLEW